jgi:hypothetical protein
MLLPVRLLFIGLLSLAGICGAALGRSLYRQEITRDISKYHVIGPFVFGFSPDRRSRLKEKVAQIREFLWNSFREHIPSLTWS